MKASIRIGVMAMIVLSMFSGVALADPIPGGQDASNYFSTASDLEQAIPYGSWYIYKNGNVRTTDVDWYKLNTRTGELLSYELDRAVWRDVLLGIYTSETTTIGNDNAGSVYVPGQTWQKVVFLPGHDVIESWYQFKLKLN